MLDTLRHVPQEAGDDEESEPEEGCILVYMVQKNNAVRKTILKKTRNYTIRTTPASVFNDAYQACVKVAGLSEMSFLGMLTAMSVPELETLKDFMLHDKTGAEKKYERIFDFSKEVAALTKVMAITAETIERGGEMCRDAVILDCCDKEKEVMNPKMVVATIEKTIAFKQGEAASAGAAPMQP